MKYMAFIFIKMEHRFFYRFIELGTLKQIHLIRELIIQHKALIFNVGSFSHNAIKNSC